MIGHSTEEPTLSDPEPGLGPKTGPVGTTSTKGENNEAGAFPPIKGRVRPTGRGWGEFRTKVFSRRPSAEC
jgi:hypothetical protein